MYDPREVLVKSLYSLTPGGSEFHNDPDRCIQWIKARLATVTEQVKKRQQVEADNAKLRAVAKTALLYVIAEVNGIRDDKRALFGELQQTLKTAGYGGED